jgi:hypothetical protein
VDGYEAGGLGVVVLLDEGRRRVVRRRGCVTEGIMRRTGDRERERREG